MDGSELECPPVHIPSPIGPQMVAARLEQRPRGRAKLEREPVHLDGARLWDASPFYNASAKKSLKDISALFDTVYVSFYKGLGALPGCCVAGPDDVIAEVRDSKNFRRT